MNCIPKVDERALPEARSGSVVEKNDQFGTSADILFDNIIFLSMKIIRYNLLLLNMMTDLSKSFSDNKKTFRAFLGHFCLKYSIFDSGNAT